MKIFLRFITVIFLGLAVYFSYQENNIKNLILSIFFINMALDDLNKEIEKEVKK